MAAQQIEKRMPFRQVLKKTIQTENLKSYFNE
jgi:ribosomal protein S3